ncbi:MAG: lipopolysaccharide assembly protein LapB, partial [Gammaproteobacteria bacterium]|nr:lipopolysaccharide assembly protein LapB [Gammaproteobacteria bacterium]
MPENLALYVLLVVALGIGFLLGRRERRRQPRNSGMVAQDYFRGLNHLLNERHDLAIDTFVEAMVVDNDTVDTHLALGSLVRRRGEVDKAIRIHQNLLARPVLSSNHRTQTELELARDYLVAGLLGRAENLLLELARKGSEKTIARELLLEIYQRESDWDQAVVVGRDLARQDRSVRAQLAHFQCELAEIALDKGDLRGARVELAKGSDFDAGCARVSLVGANVEFEAKRYREVTRLLRKTRSQDA